MFGLFTKRTEIAHRQAAIPPRMRVYAIGDIHGRLDLLRDLHQRIVEDSRQGSVVNQVVYLGDYIDRGPSSRDVVETLIAGGPGGMPGIHLEGNHEAMLLRFLEESSVGPEWLAFGGLATLMSYGVGAKSMHMPSIQRELSDKLPARHKTFLENLPRQLVIGDYF